MIPLLSLLTGLTNHERLDTAPPAEQPVATNEIIFDILLGEQVPLSVDPVPAMTDESVKADPVSEGEKDQPETTIPSDVSDIQASPDAVVAAPAAEAEKPRDDDMIEFVTFPWMKPSQPRDFSDEKAADSVFVAPAPVQQAQFTPQDAAPLADADATPVEVDSLDFTTRNLATVPESAPSATAADPAIQPSTKIEPASPPNRETRPTADNQTGIPHRPEVEKTTGHFSAPRALDDVEMPKPVTAVEPRPTPSSPTTPDSALPLVERATEVPVAAASDTKPAKPAPTPPASPMTQGTRHMAETPTPAPSAVEPTTPNIPAESPPEIAATPPKPARHAPEASFARETSPVKAPAADPVQPASTTPEIVETIGDTGRPEAYIAELRQPERLDAIPIRMATRPDHPVHRQVSEQLVVQLDAAQDGTTEISLSPEELGRVRMTVHHGEQGTSISIWAERPETLSLMRRSAESLMADLQQRGFGDARLDFSENGQPGRQQNAHYTTGSGDLPGAATPAQTLAASALPPAQGRLDIRI